MTKLDVLNEISQVQGALRDIRAQRNADGTFTDPLVQASLDKNNKRYSELVAIKNDLELQEEQARQFAEDEYRAKQEKRSPENTSMTYDDVFWRFMAQHPERPETKLTPEEMRLLTTREAKEARGTSTLITSTDSLGGYTVPQSFSDTLENMMKFYGGWSAFGMMPDSIGGTLKYPSLDDTAATGNIPGQATASTVLDLTFGNVLFGDYTIDSKIIKMSDELMNDNRVGLVQATLQDLIPRRLGTAINTYLTNGTGTSQPYGMTTTVTNSALTTAGATAITQAELLRVAYSVDRAYRDAPGAGWMVSDSIMGYLRTLEIGNTNTIPIFTPNGDVVGQEPVRLFGKPIYINNDLPAANGTTRVPVTGTKSVYFGDFSKYKVRLIGGINISRNDTLYWAERSVGFRAYRRLDGNLINANAIKYLLQA